MDQHWTEFGKQFYRSQGKARPDYPSPSRDCPGGNHPVTIRGLTFLGIRYKRTLRIRMTVKHAIISNYVIYLQWIDNLWAVTKAPHLTEVSLRKKKPHCLQQACKPIYSTDIDQFKLLDFTLNWHLLNLWIAARISGLNGFGSLPFLAYESKNLRLPTRARLRTPCGRGQFKRVKWKARTCMM